MSLVQLGYVGAKRHEGRLVHVYAQVVDGDLAERAVFFRDALCACDPGKLLEVECEDGDVRRISGPPKVAGEWGVEGDVASWQAAHRALTASTLALEGKLPDALRFALDPIRVAYLDADDATRHVLVAQVVQYVAGGS